MSGLRALRSPVALIVATGLVALAVIMVGTDWLSRRAAQNEAIDDARTTTEVLAHSVAEPHLTEKLVQGDAGAIDRFDRAVFDRLRLPDLRRVKIWAADGTIVYADKTVLIGSTYPLGADELEVLGSGDTEAEVSDLGKPENRYERQFGDLMEVYTRIRSPEGEALLFELYFSADAIDGRGHAIADTFRPVTLGALGAVVLVAALLLWVLTRRLQRSAEDRERLLRAAVDASEAERLRIARDLHDGVVQDIAGATYAVAALAQSPQVEPRAQERLRETAASLRAGQRALRSLMVEIYPPELEADSLAAALQDLLAPAGAHGVEATVEVEAIAGARTSAVRLLWRVGQEAVRNALRHAHATTLSVRVERDSDGLLVLSVVDDGRGFDPAAPAADARFGLRGLRSLVADEGGRLTVDSAPGRGTTVRVEMEDAWS